MSPTSSPEPQDSALHYENLSRHTTPPTSLRASISPPTSRRRKGKTLEPGNGNGNGEGEGESSRGEEVQEQYPEAGKSDLAAIEAGETQLRDHLEYFSASFAHYAKSSAPLSIPAFRNLYLRNQHIHGRHFVIHQHDHPVAGVHYDLRLQINETSSISWAIMYGLPGNANSRRLNRNATETRVHNLWNHLIETASASTGSLLIWDTGEYEMLPYHEPATRDTDDELSDESGEDSNALSKLSDSEKLHVAFQNRRIRIRFHGIHLPKGYTLSLRLLTSENRHSQPAKPSRKRRRKSSAAQTSQITPPTSDLDDDETVADAHPTTMDPSASALEREIAELEDEEVRRTNSYPGARNSVGSIHQRRWYCSMDRYASGFRPVRREEGSKGGKRDWERRWEDVRMLGFEPFFVMGREVERSVVTGRTADEIMSDEGVEGFVGRRGWRAVIE